MEIMNNIEKNNNQEKMIIKNFIILIKKNINLVFIIYILSKINLFKL